MTAADLVRELSRRAAAEWSVVEQRIEAVELEAGLQRHEQRTRIVLIVQVDTSDGRGTARLEIGPYDGSAEQLIDQAQQLARAAIGPAWITGSPAAPARIAMSSVDRVAEVARAVHADRVAVSRTEVSVRTAKGAHAEWTESLVRAESLVLGGDRSMRVIRSARSADGLGFATAIADASADLALLASAVAPLPGPCALILGPDALLPDDDRGVWAAFVAQADAVRTREGLARYRLGMPVASGADQIAEPLTIASDGALDLGLRSAPLDDEGNAIRRFAIIERGIATGLGMRAREAAFLHAEPNGGVRNLAVTTGSWDESPPAGTRAIVVRRLRALEIDRHTGEAALEIELALDNGAPITGGTIRLDLIAALARARRSSIPIRRGAYAGPRAILIDHAELIA